MSEVGREWKGRGLPSKKTTFTGASGLGLQVFFPCRRKCQTFGRCLKSQWIMNRQIIRLWRDIYCGKVCLQTPVFENSELPEHRGEQKAARYLA